MSERKVLNKYYPPDFDPNKIPKLKRPRNRQFNIRIMAPFNMRCGTCGEYIYKGKKFNSRQEKVEDEDYLGLMIFRFYIKCPRCVSEISFKTDPKNTDYELEAGATRNFEALRTAEILAEREIREKEEEEKDNPMKVLENRTKASRQEMEMIETLEELREINSRHAKVDHENMIKLHKAYEEQLRRLQEEEDEEFIRTIFGKGDSGQSVKRLHDDDDDDEGLSSASSTPRVQRFGKPSDLLVQGSDTFSEASVESHDSGIKLPTKMKPGSGSTSWQKSVGSLRSKSSLSGLVKKKPKPSPPDPTPDNTLTVHSSDNENKSISASPNVQSGISQEKSKIVAQGSTVDSSSEGVTAEKGVSSGSAFGNAAKPSGLSLLGAYSGSETGSDSDT